MTQKELLYFEDAINHESSIIKIIQDNLNNLKDQELIAFMNNQLIVHQDLKQNLMGMLGEKANGW